MGWNRSLWSTKDRIKQTATNRKAVSMVCYVIHTGSQVVFPVSCGAGIPIYILQMKKLRLRRVKTLSQSPRGKRLLQARLFCLAQSPGRFPMILCVNRWWVSMVQKEGRNLSHQPLFSFHTRMWEICRLDSPFLSLLFTAKWEILRIKKRGENWACVSS